MFFLNLIYLSQLSSLGSKEYLMVQSITTLRLQKTKQNDKIKKMEVISILSMKLIYLTSFMN